MMASRGMGAIAPSKVPRAVRRGDDKPVLGASKKPGKRGQRARLAQTLKGFK